MLIDKKKHKFRQGSSFDSVFNLYKFDRELRLLILRELEKIEVAIRAKMIYVLSHRKGTYWYTESDNFKSATKHVITLSKIESEFKRSDEQFIMSFQNKYSNPLPPSWMMMEISSFGVLSSLFSNFISGKDKKDISRYFGVNDKTLASWLHSIVYIRNVCAHHTRLWNRIMRIQPIIPRNTTNQWLVNNDIQNNRTYFVLSLIIYLMNTINPKHTIVSRFKALLTKYQNVDTAAMGFCSNWKDEPLWQ